MSEQNKAIVRRFGEEAWNKGNLKVIDELVDAGFVGYGPGRRVARGRKELKQVITRMRSAFPDLHFTVDDEAAEGNTVVTRWTGRGTHKGDYRGIAPTGRRVTFAGIAIRHIAGGKVAVEWTCSDILGLLRQLGAVPSPPPSG